MIRPLAAVAVGVVALLGVSATAAEQSADRDAASGPQTVATNQLFAMAEAAERHGDSELARTYYRALTRDPALEMRNEARFRLAMMLTQIGKFAESAGLLRAILDEQPRAQRVRLELARLLDLMGDESSARRLVREAQADGLPADVVRFVDRYSAALRARKPFGASLDMAIAPDSNINRATRSETLGTVFGDFVLDDDAKETSGVGLAMQGQAFARFRLSGRTAILARASGSGNFYRQADFDDIAIGVSAGPEVNLGKDRLAVEAGYVRRWFGGELLSSSVTLGASYLHPVGRVAQVRATASLGKRMDGPNRLQDGNTYTASLGYERALSATLGIGASAAFDRQSLRDGGYSTTGLQATVFTYHEIGATTVVGSIGYGGLAADKRLFLYPERRKDRFYRFSLGATFRQLAVSGFAPFGRLTVERNASTIALFDYRRTRTELGLTRAF